MPRFFVENIGEQYAAIENDDAVHIIRSLRMREGDEITLSDQQGYDYKTVIKALDTDRVTVEILEKMQNTTEPKVRTVLYQALPKGDKLEFIVQKAVELGVYRIVPILTKRCISRPKAKAMERKIERLQKIALEAAKQSQRGIVPEIGELMDYADALEAISLSGKGILLYEDATRPLSDVLSPLPDEISIIVGSEGGFSTEEAEAAKEKGLDIISLGNRILRCETAPICALSAISYASGEF